MKWITTLIDKIYKKNLVPSNGMATLYYPNWPEKENSLTAEESMKLVREDYEQRNRTTESWMTIHDREYLDLQKENK